MIVPIVPEGGNTITPSSKQISPSIHWCFTLNNWNEDNLAYLSAIVPQLCKSAIIGSEVGESGTPHLQGYVEFKKKARPMGFFSALKTIHWEKCKGSKEDNIKYCSKEGKVVYTLNCDVVIKKPIKIITNLYAWQKDIENMILTDPDDRSVHWYYDKKGNIGKSAFIKYCVVKHKALFCSGGKMSDIMNLVFNQDMDTCNCVLFDIPRANEGHVSYSALESIKNGMVCNTKYETGVKIFNAPHLVCFANFKPDDMTKLSADRWHIVNLGDDDDDSDDD